MRNVIEKRFGLKGGKKFTLEAIGKEYKITRERVRQIESDALHQLRKPEHIAKIKPILAMLEEHLEQHGRVMAEEHLFSSLGEKRYHPYFNLFLEVGRPSFQRLKETETLFARWTLDGVLAEKVKDLVERVVRSLQESGRPVSAEELFSLTAYSAETLLGKTLDRNILEAYLRTSKVICQNPYGEYGLASWPTIKPRGIRDKAYLALVKSGRPLHFTAVARAIDAAGLSVYKRKAHPQTVHNELIKDPRFVLVGRGIYALREWGYEPGTVREVLISILKEKSSPLSKEEIVNLVCQKRLIKPQTVLLNLQNKSFFRRTEEGKYTLV